MNTPKFFYFSDELDNGRDAGWYVQGDRANARPIRFMPDQEAWYAIFQLMSDFQIALFMMGCTDRHRVFDGDMNGPYGYLCSRWERISGDSEDYRLAANLLAQYEIPQ